MYLRTSPRPVSTGLDRGLGLNRLRPVLKPQKTGLPRFGPVFCGFAKNEDRSRSRSVAFEAKDQDRTGLSITNLHGWKRKKESSQMNILSQ